MASKQAHLESTSFVKLVKELIGVELSKDEQKSNWRAKELSDKQMAYAANDVIYNIQLYSILNGKVRTNNNELILVQKNKEIEKSPLKKFKPKLKSKHRELNVTTQRKIMKLLHLSAQLAEKRNVPPIYVFPDELIDELIAAGKAFDCISSFKNCPKPYQVNSPTRNLINQQIKNILMK